MTNSKPLPDGTVIMAEAQYAGRGQRENTWYAEPGKNLTFSILLKPSFLAAASQFDLTRVASLGVYDALEPLLGSSLRIKWPNDIYYGDNKLGGMLIECILQGNHIKHAIVGIGLNVNQEHFAANAANATSVKQILHTDYELKEILSQICSHVERYYLKLKAGQLNWLRDTYLSRIYWLNEHRLFKSKGYTFKGVIKDVKDNGLLVVVRDGVESTYNLKEIEFLNKL